MNPANRDKPVNPAAYTPNQRQAICKQLMQGFTSSQQQDAETRWSWLVAAHVVGQHDFALHWQNHVTMLRFALQLKDYPEAAGQLMRLALVPLGHLLGKLPAGNIGRATVSAFRPMALDPRMGQLILQAQAAAAAEIR